MSQKPLAVIGAGGNARVVLELLRAVGRPATVVVSGDPVAAGTTLGGVGVIGGDALFMKRYAPAEVELVNGLGGVGDNSLRRKVYEQYVGLGYRFPIVIHPSAVIAEGVVPEAGTIVMAGAVIQPGVTLGENVLVNTRSVIEHDCRIGAHAHLSIGAVLCGEVTVGEGTHIGAGATVIQGATVGAETIVGLGAAVIGDLPNRVTAVGTPARIVKGKL